MTALEMKRFAGFKDASAQPLGRRKDGKDPRIVITGEIRLTVENGIIRIGFSRGHCPVKIQGQEEFQAILKQVATGTYEYTDCDPTGKPDLALGLKQDAYVVIRLCGDLNWQFMRDAAPFTLSPNADSDIYYDANRVDAEGNIVPTYDKDGRIIVKDGCLTAFFIAEGKTASERHPDGYVHNYNFNIELKGEDEYGNVYWQPLVIDPDIRNPGPHFN